ncbi:Hemocyte protein-glutamine gamma-glutamyltransferase [Trachymyrmex cornetzi]|uniref:Hemocyte protein-glutamine gamma-glutamyltransferase n=1 Tax=Trachymyrmex cornetzi TaxID=471704 RepID=A0A195EN57_9HYME|nr:Hemocyte protein-glutamine gamma-glutamyltransferase [Trachymyrmex cornetzi]
MRLVNASTRTRSRSVNRFAGEPSNGILRTRFVVHCHNMMSEEPLEIEAVHLYEKENAETHRTFNFEMVHQDPAIPVLRRGQTFHMALRFNREYVDETDIVRLLFSFGPNPNVLRGTRGVNTITNREAYLTDLEAWGVRMVGAHGVDLSVEVRSPIDSPVGVWQLNVETTTLGRRKAPNTYSYDKDIYLLFNPWLKEDLVYLEDEQLLDEYILNDVGKIWVGPWGSSRGREWVFGQFDACVLPACQLLLERSGIKAISRGDPVKMVRAISRIINSNDDKAMMREIHKKHRSERWVCSDESGNANLALFADPTTLDYIVLRCIVRHELLCTMCHDLHIISARHFYTRRSIRCNDKCHCNRLSIIPYIIVSHVYLVIGVSSDKNSIFILIRYPFFIIYGTEVERLTLYRAVRSTEMAKRFYSMPSPGKEDVEFDLVELERVNIGEPFAVTVNIKNKSDETRTIQAILSAGSVYYTGVKANLVKRASGDFVLQPNATEQLRLSVTLNDYLDKLVEYCIMKLYCIATVKETRQTWADEDDFQVLKPNIDVKIEGEPVVGQPSTITLSFKNPLKKTLTSCQFNYAGPGLSRNKTLTFRDVGPEENVYVEHQLVPQKPGQQKIIATFTSKELVDITGCATVDVLEAE